MLLRINGVKFAAILVKHISHCKTKAQRVITLRLHIILSEYIPIIYSFADTGLLPLPHVELPR